MKLHSPAFEKALNRDVKSAIRESPKLRKEYRQAKKARPRRVPGAFGRVIMTIFFSSSVLTVADGSHHPAMGLEFIILWTFGWAFYHAMSLWTLLYRHSDILALRLLPVEGKTLFVWLFQKFRAKALYSALDLAAAFSALDLMLKFSPMQWLGTLPIIVCTWVLMMALVLLFCARIPPALVRKITGGLTFLGFVLIFGAKLSDGKMLAFLDRIAPSLNVVLPTGWMVSQYELLLRQPDWMLPALLVPAAAVIFSMKNSLDLLRKKFRLLEQSLAADIQPAPGAAKRSAAVANNAAGQPPSPDEGPTGIEEHIEARQFLIEPEWPQFGWLENLLWRWLTPREKALAEFTFPAGYSFTKPWLKILRNFVVGSVLAYAVGMTAPALMTWSFAGVLFFTGIHALAYITITGNAFRMQNSGGVNIPIYAVFGIGYRELSRLLVKCSIVQLPLLIPYVVACGAIMAWLYGLPWTDGLIPGFRLAILALSTRYIFMMFSFSSGTNDSSRFKFGVLVLFGLIAILCLFFLGLIVTSFFVPNKAIAWILSALAVGDAWLLFRTYGWFYNGNLFDLMAAPRR